MYVSAFYEGIYFIDSCILFEGIQEAAAVLLLPCLLREKGGNTEDFIKICMVWLIPCIIEIHIHNLQGPYKLYKVLLILTLGLA